MCRFFLDTGLEDALFAEGIIGILKNFLYFEACGGIVLRAGMDTKQFLQFLVSHVFHPQSGRKGSRWYYVKHGQGVHRPWWNLKSGVQEKTGG